MLKIIFMVLALYSSQAFSGSKLIESGSVKSVENTSQSTNQFVVWIDGDSICSGLPIRFKESNFSSLEVGDRKDALNRAFAMLLAAQATGYSVTIYGAINDCNAASWVKTTRS